MHRARAEADSEQQSFVKWSDRLSALEPTMDVSDDGHLFEWLDLHEWEQVFGVLEAMPSGSRSLHQAILATYPEVLP